MAKVFAWLAFCLQRFPQGSTEKPDRQGGRHLLDAFKKHPPQRSCFSILGGGAERNRVAKPVMMFAKRAPQDA
jgi:hypothetical protein